MQGSNHSLLRYPLLQSSHFWSCKKSLWADRVLFAIPPEICCSNPRAKANSERSVWDWLYLSLWGAALGSGISSSAGSTQPWESLQQNWSLFLPHQGRRMIKPLKRKTKSLCIIFSSILVTTALHKSGRKEVKKEGHRAVPHQQLSAAPQASERETSNVLR